MPEQTILSEDISIADALKAFYTVPDYQREYVWEVEQVDQLLADICAEMTGSSGAGAPEYFIGSIVVCPAEGVFELIDGQQRMTTLFLTICAIRDRLQILGEAPPGALEHQIAAASTDARGRDQFRYRLQLQYEDAGDVLVEIATKALSDAYVATRSVANIRSAYAAAIAFLAREFQSDANELRVFYGYLINKVKLIRIQTQDVAKALKIFETINDRGVGLDSMDLLKNLLFMRATRAQFDELRKHWKKLQDTIFAMGEKPLRFLRYYIFSRYDVDLLREDEIYGWFSRNEAKCGYAVNPIGFALELLKAAQAYQNFLAGSDIAGKRNRHLESLKILGGKAARQHLILLLAGRHLPAPLLDRLAQEVEDLFFVYVITREPTRDFERNFARWAMDLRKVSSDAELSAFFESRLLPAKAQLSNRFDDAFARLDADAVQQYRLVYILAKLTQHVELAAYGETEMSGWLSRYTSGGYEIEHIYPQQPRAECIEEFGELSDPVLTKRLGNLVLVERSINASLGNRPYSRKRPVYVQSQLLLTRALAERPQVGNTRIDSAVANLDPYMNWNETAIRRRQNELSELARRVWNVPAPLEP